MPVSGGRVALVTGGSRGIGRAIVLKLASAGHDVAFCYHSNVDEATLVEKQVREGGARCHHAPCDVTDLASVQQFVKNAESALGPIDTLVNSAGIVRDSPLVLMSEQDWHSVLRTNLDGTFNTCRSVVFGFMKRKSGTIVNVSSVAGVYGNATQANYAASKAGIIGMSKSLTKELAPYGVRVNVVAPGFIETDMTDRLPKKVRDGALSMIPLRRFGQSDDVADLVGFLCSDRSAYITGQVIQVDGGIAL